MVVGAEPFGGVVSCTPFVSPFLSSNESHGNSLALPYKDKKKSIETEFERVKVVQMIWMILNLGIS